MATSFSRLQLAAALLEYDNDPDNPEAPRRSAQDSAIFAHLRRANDLGSSSFHGRRSTDYLAVTIPTDAASVSAMNDTRRSRSSIAALQNMFGAGGAEEEEELPEEEEIEVDLESWGLDSFIPKEKGSKSKAGKVRDNLDIIPNPHPASPVATTHQTEKHHSRSMSFGNFGAAGAFLESQASTLPINFRRNSIANPLDTSGYSKAEIPPRRRWASDHILMEDLPVRPPLLSSASLTNQGRDTIPFPVSYTPEDRSEARFSRPPSAMMRMRAQSNATLGSKAQELDEANPFSVRPPSPSRASRFDPKAVAHVRALSNATMLTSASRPLSGGQDMTVNRADRHDAASMRTRRMSDASWGTRNMLDDDFEQFEEGPYGRDGHYSRMALMRPKVLIMPSPLQSAEPPKPPAPTSFVPSGFQLSTAEPASTVTSVAQPPTSAPIASNSFTPNPRLSLSASQLLFRNTLLVGGERDISYGDIDERFHRATEDGEKIDWPEEEVEQTANENVSENKPPTEDMKPSRPPGKLYGRSLIDDLESRKVAQKAKQRVFTGDQRPSMMDRRQPHRSSTWIDPVSLQQGPGMKELQNPLQRRGSKLQPLLNFKKEDSPKESGLMPNSTIPRGKSVFGVDTLWEREMAKLKEIEAQEKKEQEEQRRREEEEEAKRSKKKKKKSKGKEREPMQEAPGPAATNGPSGPSSPPVLPEIQRAIVRRRPTDTPADDESDDDSSASEILPSSKSIVKTDEGQGWVSEDEDQPKQVVRTTGVGPRYQPARRDEDSDEDLPLSVTLQRALNKIAPPGGDEDSDEDKPIAALIDRSKSMTLSDRLTTISNSVSGSRKQNQGNDDDDDDVPLGVRASRIPPISQSFQSLPTSGNNDDDDRPLGMHPQQQRRTQYQLFAQQQQQQQQMLIQAQMRNTMAFGAPPSMYGSVLTPFAPPMQSPMMPVMMAPPFNPTPPQDPANYGKVDRWRRDVAIDGSQ